ncbi:MAG TPA: regulatory protein RecX [Gemmatimonadaceae bacterium]|nr:regulatory protein RecX [Gemmatimonadaceae bacterium]
MSPSNKAYEYALNLLSARAYTARNLRRKLVQKEFEPEEVESAMARLTASNLLDDAKFAAEYARQKLVVGGSSARRVEQELQKKGIGREQAKEAVSTVVDQESVDSGESAERAARKKFKSLSGLEPDVQRRRLFGFLARRGFALDDVKRAVNTVIAGEEESAD